MTQAVIEEHWMTIGTDNKTNDIFTATGRVRAGDDAMFSRPISRAVLADTLKGIFVILVILIYIHQETNPAQLLVYAPVGGWH
jgi:hypothetical protein